MLLILITLGASIFIYSRFYFSAFTAAELDRLSAGEVTQLQQTIERCYAAYEANRPADPLTDREAFLAAEEALGQCLDPFQGQALWWMLGGIALVFILATLIYWLIPIWKLKRGNLSPISTEDAPDVVEYLHDLCREMGLSRPPRFVWNPLNPVCTGLAFGRLGRYYVAISGGLVTQFYTDRVVFRAVLLHELAHLRNGDVDKTYFTVAIWWAFLVGAVLPWGITLFGLPVIYLLQFSLIWRLLALAALVYLTRNAVLRAREFYADVRASTFDGAEGGLNRALEALPQAKTSRWGRIFTLHPDPVIRRQCLQDTGPLFRLSLWDALATGIAASIVLPGVLELLVEFNISFWKQFVAGFVFAPIVMAIAGTGVWRATFAAMFRGEAPQRAGRLGLALGLGVLLGFSLTLFGLEETDIALAETPIDRVLIFTFQGLWAVVMLASLVLFMRWVRAGAGSWLPVAVRQRSPRASYMTGLSIAGAILAIWFGILFLGREVGVIFLSGLGASEGFMGLAGMILLIPVVVWINLQNPILLISLVCLWAFPLAAHLWRRRANSAPASPWVYLDAHAPEPVFVSQQAVPKIKSLLKPAIIGGLVFWGLWLLLRVGVRAGVSEMTRDSDQFKIALFLVGVFLAAFMQAGVGALVAGRVKSSASLYGLLAAFVAGSVMGLGFYGINVGFGGEFGLDRLWFNISQIINAGALLTLPTAVVVSVLAGWFRR